MSRVNQGTSEKIQALFDGELSAEERREMEALLADDADANASFEELGLLRQAIVGTLEAEAAAVPEARFEQIWDEVERTIVRDARLQEAADVNVSIWSRMAAFFKPLWAPTVAVAGVAAAVAIFVATSDDGAADDANTPAVVASKEPMPAPQESAVLPAAPAEEIVAVKVEAGEPASNNEAEIQRIEFGGKSGRIDRIEGKQGITTVIWISDDDETTDSERSL